MFLDFINFIISRILFFCSSIGGDCFPKPLSPQEELKYLLYMNNEEANPELENAVDIVLTFEELLEGANVCFPIDAFTYDRLYLTAKLNKILKRASICPFYFRGYKSEKKNLVNKSGMDIHRVPFCRHSSCRSHNLCFYGRFGKDLYKISRNRFFG